MRYKAKTSRFALNRWHKQQQQPQGSVQLVIRTIRSTRLEISLQKHFSNSKRQSATFDAQAFWCFPHPAAQTAQGQQTPHSSRREAQALTPASPAAWPGVLTSFRAHHWTRDARASLCARTSNFPRTREEKRPPLPPQNCGAKKMTFGKHCALISSYVSFFGDEMQLTGCCCFGHFLCERH